MRPKQSTLARDPPPRATSLLHCRPTGKSAQTPRRHRASLCRKAASIRVQVRRRHRPCATLTNGKVNSQPSCRSGQPLDLTPVAPAEEPTLDLFAGKPVVDLQPITDA